MGDSPYSQRVYVAPFGRYEGTRPNEYPANEVLIGRERERARMVDWLLTFGHRGAYLVTGYRGVGKSAFVQYCVKQYEDDVYGRYLQSKVGRSLFWDRIAIAVLVALVLFLPVVVSQVLQGLMLHLAYPWTYFGARSSLLLSAAVIVPFFLIALFPLVNSLLLGSDASANYYSSWDAKLVAFAVGLAVPLALVGFTMSGPEAASFFLALTGWTYLAVHGMSIHAEPGTKGWLDHDPGSAKFGGGEPSYTAVRVCWAIGAVVLAGGAAFLHPHLDEPEGAVSELAVAYLFIAASSACLGWILRASDASRLRLHLKKTKVHGLGVKETTRTKRTHAIMVGFFVVVQLVMVLGLWLIDYSPKSNDAYWVLGALYCCLLAFFVACLIRRRESIASKREQGEAEPWFYFHPRPRLVLIVKAAFGFVLGIQILRDLFDNLSPEKFHSVVGKPGWLCSVPAFSDWRNESLWLVLTSVFVFWQLYLEHDWIARRHERTRQDDAYDPIPAPDDQNYTRLAHLHLNREFAKATTFWSVFRVWLPVLTVRINLGFDDLSHTHVVTAMLAGLRSQYHRAFISWRSRLGIVWRVFGTCVLLFLATALGSAFQWLFPIKAEWAKLVLERTFELPMPLSQEPHLARVVLPYDPGTQTFGVNVYHLAAFILVVFVVRMFGARLGVPSYRTLYAKLTELLESLSSTVHRVRQQPRMNLPTPYPSIEDAVNSSQVETPPQDPRAIEQAFLDILSEVQESFVPLPMAGHAISLPAPRITFIFDELDKIGVRSVDRTGDRTTDSHTGDRERSRRIHRLLADLKNLLSTAPARFIFVGGRELHDEWLADLTSRQPLLSNVFDGEIYLPTLLVDRIAHDPKGHQPLDGVYAFLNAHLSRTKSLFERWQRRRRWGDQWFSVFRHEPEHFFVQAPDPRGPAREEPERGAPGEPKKGVRPSLLSTWTLHDVTHALRSVETRPPKPQKARNVRWRADFFRQLSEYLAFRSRGNPKRLNGLIERFVRPVGHVVRDRPTRWSTFDCQHVLHFDQVERFSIQLVANIFRRLEPVLRTRANFSDDKNVRSALYLADFLLKFHRRAFSWPSLERIDELLHVHRAPDLRRLLSEILSHWSQCYVYPVLEGLHAFRFRSEVAAEVRYISRSSEGEMAAFNFTLDEAQALKTEYQTRLERMSGNQEACFEIRAALGELHDFDEEFEEARRHYTAAIDEIDAGVERSKSAIRGKLVDESQVPVGLRIGWAVARLRLMLQVGMTYERSRNYERAFAEYRDARALAQESIVKLIDDYGQDLLSQRWSGDEKHLSSDLPKANKASDPHEIRRPNRLETLKHLPILFQPLFASAWVAEKAVSMIDSSLNMIEEALADARRSLPLVRVEEHLATTTDPTEVSHTQFFLAMANLHHNAGNVYFFKGCQSGEPFQEQSGGGSGTPKVRKGFDGYLPRAAHHYARALVDIRRFTTHRLASSEFKLVSLSRSPQAHSEPSDVRLLPLPGDVWPEFFLRRTAAALFGLADVELARISLLQLMDENPGSSSRDPRERDREEQGQFVEWMSRFDVPTPNRANELISHQLEAPEPAPRVVPTIEISELEKVRRYLALSGWGARLLEVGGHYEEAARERVWTAQCVETLLWSLRALSSEGAKGRKASNLPAWTALLLKEGAHAIDDARTLILRAAAGSSEPAMPTHARRIARSLGLLAADIGRTADDQWVTSTKESSGAPAQTLPFKDLARRFHDLAPPPKTESKETASWDKPSTIAQAFRGGLRDSIERNTYSMLNRLMTLHVLVLDAALRQPDTKTNDADEERMLLDDLVRLNTEYSSPMHFTPFHFGAAVMLWTLRQRKAPEGHPSTPYLEIARVALSRSREMYSGGGAYYDMIAELSYLDDDFNDRCFHVHHAIQMMGADLTASLLTRAHA